MHYKRSRNGASLVETSPSVVLVVNEKTPRGHWPMGLIEEVFPESYGYVRNVKVKTATTVYKRDIRKLCLLEGDQNS